MPFTPYRWTLLLSFVVNVQYTLPLSRLLVLNRNDKNLLEHDNLRVVPGEISYSFFSAPVRNIPSGKDEPESPCSKFGNWISAGDPWTNYLKPQGWILCHKDYGNDGNCFYHAVSGLLKEISMKRNDLKFSEKLPQGILESAKNLKYDNTYFTHKDLRKLTAIYFVGVNPYDGKAVQNFDKDAFREKIEFAKTMQDVENYGDLKWEPGERFKELESGTDYLEVAKKVYNDLSSSSPVKTWAAHHDIIALSHILNVAFFLIPSNSQSVQFIKHNDSEPLYTFSLYYINMIHFEGAGFGKESENELYIRISKDSIPDTFSKLLPRQSNS